MSRERESWDLVFEVVKATGEKTLKLSEDVDNVVIALEGMTAVIDALERRVKMLERKVNENA